MDNNNSTWRRLRRPTAECWEALKLNLKLKPKNQNSAARLNYSQLGCTKFQQQTTPLTLGRNSARPSRLERSRASCEVVSRSNNSRAPSLGRVTSCHRRRATASQTIQYLTLNSRPPAWSLLVSTRTSIRSESPRQGTIQSSSVKVRKLQTSIF